MFKPSLVLAAGLFTAQVTQPPAPQPTAQPGGQPAPLARPASPAGTAAVQFGTGAVPQDHHKIAGLFCRKREVRPACSNVHASGVADDFPEFRDVFIGLVVLLR